MAKVPPPPIQSPLYDDPKTGLAANPWVEFFNRIYTGDTGSTWTPNFVNLTVAGTVTYSAVYYKISQTLTYYRITITPAAASSSTATGGTTYIDNFPLKLLADSPIFVVAGTTGFNAGVAVASNNRLYVPGWTTVNVPLTITGTAEAR